MKDNYQMISFISRFLKATKQNKSTHGFQEQINGSGGGCDYSQNCTVYLKVPKTTVLQSSPHENKNDIGQQNIMMEANQTHGDHLAIYANRHNVGHLKLMLGPLRHN